TGCGDAFAAGFVAALLHGLGPRQALDAAVRCAGIKAQRRGTRGLYAAVRRRRAWILGAGR
ncbi:MAG TPA: PfkB family carbohydrate kinase, partial [Acidobacteriota bacterium]